MDHEPRDDGFLSRWSRRKALVRGGETVAATPLPAAALDPAPAATPAAVVLPAEAPPPDPVAEAPPPPTLGDVAALTRESDYGPFVARSVAPDVRNAALKKLFTDPHFNVMDGLDTYIGDYNTPDPLPPGMLRKMVQSQLLGLFADEEPAAAPACESPADENPAVQLQPDDDARRPAAEPGVGPDPAVQH